MYFLPILIHRHLTKKIPILFDPFDKMFTSYLGFLLTFNSMQLFNNRIEFCSSVKLRKRISLHLTEYMQNTSLMFFFGHTFLNKFTNPVSPSDTVNFSSVMRYIKVIIAQQISKNKPRNKQACSWAIFYLLGSLPSRRFLNNCSNMTWSIFTLYE